MEERLGDKKTASKFEHGDKTETPVVLIEETGFEQLEPWRQTGHDKLEDNADKD